MITGITVEEVKIKKRAFEKIVFTLMQQFYEETGIKIKLISPLTKDLRGVRFGVEVDCIAEIELPRV